MNLSLRSSFVAFLAITLLAVMPGCGGGGMTSIVQGNALMMNGNFGLTATSQAGPNIFQLGGPFQTSSGGSVTGTMNIDSSTSTCFDFFTGLTFTGTLGSSGQLSLTSSAQAGQVVNLTGHVSSDGMTISSGTYSITGGCAGGDHGTFSGFQVPLINGTYTGTFTSGGVTVNISVALSQGTGNPFLLGGTATFTNGAACALFSANIIGGQSGIAGADVRARMIDNFSVYPSTFQGVFSDSTTKTIKGTISVGTGPCNGTSIPLTLSMP
jgi:hypothetical protein